MTTLFNQLQQAITEQNQQGELPDFVVPRLLQVATAPQRFADQTELVRQLLQQVMEYEAFSEVSCEKIGFGIEDLNTTLGKLGVD